MNQKRRKAQEGGLFQDRKLNQCAICKTQKELALTAGAVGNVYFLCRPHYHLDQSLDGQVQKASGATK